MSRLDPGEWTIYTVQVPSAGPYRIDLRYAASGTGAAIRIGFGGGDVTDDVALAATGGGWRTITVATAVTLRAGVQALRLSTARTAGAFEVESIVVSGG